MINEREQKLIDESVFILEVVKKYDGDCNISTHQETIRYYYHEILNFTAIVITLEEKNGRITEMFNGHEFNECKVINEIHPTRVYTEVISLTEAYKTQLNRSRKLNELL